MPQCIRLAPALLLATLVASPLVAQDPSQLRDLNTHSPFAPPSSLEAWQTRATELKLQLQVSLGLFPTLELDAVRPEIYGKIERDGYTIEKVTFESLPGFYVTGNLYRPAKMPGESKFPAVLSPHGHWSDARFYDAKPSDVRQLLASGAERFENAARNHIQARCVQLARMGCIVYHWDMIGYCDSVQISFERAHRFAKQPRESEVTDAGWLLFSPLAEAHCQSVLGLQSLATQRAIDMLLTLPEVDPDRIAITGASGGGTQSFIGAALDDRISVAFPAVMVSTGMQGGCTCENACLLRTGTGNVEMAALIAPRPLGLTAANDWTKTMAEDGYPELQKLYDLFDARKKVALFPAIHFGHNYNHVSRVAMYGWLNEHFGLGAETPVLESDFDLALRDELHVWDEAHPIPESGEDFERKLMKLWADILDSQLDGLLEGDQQQLQQLADMLSSGWRVCLGLTSSPLASTRGVNEGESIELRSEHLPPWNLYTSLPKAATSNKAASNGAPESHKTIMTDWKPTSDDLHFEISGGGGGKTFYAALAGQTLNDSGPQQAALQALVGNPRLAACYTFGYNLPLFAQRAQQIGLTIHWLSQQNPNQSIAIRGHGSDAALAAAGAFVAQELAGGNEELAQIILKIHPDDFSFAKVDSIRDPNFLPGSARFWDLPGLIACLKADVEIETSHTGDYEKVAPLVKQAGGSISVK